MFSSRMVVKYSRLSETEVDPEDPTLAIKGMEGAAFDFKSAFKYDEGVKSVKYKSEANYGPAFRYSGPLSKHDQLRDFESGTAGSGGSASASAAAAATPASLILMTWMATFLSYLVLVLTWPVTYWFLVKKLGEFDRLVVFRMGRMSGVKGPGRVIVFPWMDRTKKIDVRTTAFSVPPQQFITADGGIVEMGAEIQYGVVDVVTMVREVADHQDILRSLGKTLLVKILVKKTVHNLERGDKRIPAQAILDELNDQVRKWGIDVHSVALSEPKVLKQAENSSTVAVGSILKSLGMKQESNYPTPQEFVRATHGLEGDDGSTATKSVVPGVSVGTSGGYVSASCCVVPPEVPSGGNPALNLLQLMAAGNVPGVPGVIAGSTITGARPLPGDEQVFSWAKCLETILQSEFGNQVMEDEACGLYRMEITNTGASGSSTDVFYLELGPTARTVTQVPPGSDDSGRRPDVAVKVSSPDLSSVLEGSLSPLQAYLTGRIAATGDVRKLMFFDKLSRRGHKPGSMFNV